MRRDQSAILSRQDLVDDLTRLGVGAGDLLMVHASLRAIGPVDGGASTVIDALEAAAGPDGTLLMILGARDDFAWVNDRPERERPGLLADSTPFDPLDTPALPEVGVLAEVLRQTSGTSVSDNPEGRFGAAVSLSSLVDDTPWHDYYGPGSPLDRFVAAGGKVLRMGANLDTVTALHYAEYLAQVPGKRRVRRHRLVKGPDGPEVRYVEALHDEEGIVDRPGEDYFATILKAYLETGRASRGVVGGAPSELIDAADIVEFGASWMTENLTRVVGG